MIGADWRSLVSVCAPTSACLPVVALAIDWPLTWCPCWNPRMYMGGSIAVRARKRSQVRSAAPDGGFAPLPLALVRVPMLGAHAHAGGIQWELG